MSEIRVRDWDNFQKYFKKKTVPARTVLLREGEISKRAYYIEKGCVRLWFNNQGKDVTFQFFFEKSGVSSVESFRTNLPSLYTIETIEPCTLLTITKSDFQRILQNSPTLARQIEEQTFQRLVHYQRLFLSRIKDNPQKRYVDLIKDHPMIIQRVPQHYIASYLGITPVSLSRIRKRS